ncbi:hypothetical protein [Ferrovum myxofaciens]|uniref:Uncharacterized protein n=1 Tax=Ferrovum myxofaciens TaxID=416213 RepID=A0A9E6N031_9PROT|nr:hypothetical protein [Ferrovum myxofaciens]MBU6994415.1 hypothetical protein [Ferrovum myxofaciens]QSH81940.1 MAG: hypothetical protein HO273_04180 [Ferrovum myxofaciens]QWY75731.1 MAG: hypothetical protein JVY19_04695 [Ferrovum myxofaciens]QWY78461.1 MAG: hypothetical protein JZL65_05170 [Ferrovum myxofaciens]
MKKDVTTAAERQAAYRKRRCEAGENGERRINLWVSTGASLAVQRLASRYCVTKRELIERLVVAEEKKILSGISSDELDVYLEAGERPLRSNGQKARGKNMKKEENIESS